MRDAQEIPAEELLRRAERVLALAKFPPLAPATAREYRRVAARIARAAAAAGSDWRGIEGLTEAPGYLSVLRAAWCRWSHRHVRLAVLDLHLRRITPEVAVRRLRAWVPGAEASPPRPGVTAVIPPVRPPPADAKPRPASRSKRGGIRLLPSDWQAALWSAAVGRGFAHLDALAVLACTGCRPVEVCRAGVDVRWHPRGLEFLIVGAKVHGEAGQPWRKLVVAVDGPEAEHLAELVDRAGGALRVAADCSPNSLSTGIADLGAVAGLIERVSAYDYRHMRAAAVRNAFPGDVEKCSAWLGHSADSSLRYYGRLPRSSGVRGPQPLDVEVPRPVRRPAAQRTARLDHEAVPV